MTLRLDEAALARAPEVRVLLAEPPLSAGMAEVRPRYARAAAPFVSVQRGRSRGEVVLRGVPAGDVVVVASWQSGRSTRGLERHVVWRDLTARAGEVHRLGHLRPAPRTTALTLELVERGAHGSADVTALALARPCALPVELLPEVEPPGITPVLRLDVVPGTTVRLHGARARKVTYLRDFGPELLASGWLLGPATRRDAPSAVQVRREVARGVPIALRLAGTPAGTAAVRLWARRDEGRGVWLAESAEAGPVPPGLGSFPAAFAAELALAPGPWRVLAQAVDADGAPTGATSEHALDVPSRGTQRELTLAPAASLVVRAGRGRVGEPVGVRPRGWTVDLASAAIGPDGRAELHGLVAEAAHDVATSDAVRRVHAPRAGQTKEVRLDPPR